MPPGDNSLITSSSSSSSFSSSSSSCSACRRSSGCRSIFLLKAMKLSAAALVSSWRKNVEKSITLCKKTR
ncbi:hypothetical protein E2C01_099900 [Portunus trituberculatus]|uniref:Uncharacterized protein n=1 Tax=Portunus trituberculatus TaxID=210409 RepID=A0A5B7KI09_PORTR|nr:hypothetical protein [Portunus trituberculatus]